MKELPRVRLWVKAVCPQCGFRYRYVDELDTHELRCPYPDGIRLRFIDEGDPIAEVRSD